MEAFDVLGDPVRRRLLQQLAHRGEVSAGVLAEAAGAEFGISQPAVSQHLRVLRDSGFVTVRAEGARRVYALRGEPLADAERWLADLRGFWSQRLDALETELARGRRARRHTGTTDAAPAATDPRRMA